MMDEPVHLLQEGRRRARTQAAFYRKLAGDAEDAGDIGVAERLNDLLADEQHHVSRLTARLLELGQKPDEEASVPGMAELDAWEGAARIRERAEVEWYEQALERVNEPRTRSVLQEILDAERHHRDSLSGKWTSAVPGEPPTEEA
jgi:rubrerythrin